MIYACEGLLKFQLKKDNEEEETFGVSVHFLCLGQICVREQPRVCLSFFFQPDCFRKAG